MPVIRQVLKEGYDTAGMRIPAGATRIMKTAQANNTTTIVHTVTATKTLYLEAVLFAGYQTTAGTNTITLLIRNAADTTVYTWVVRLDNNNTDKVTQYVTFPTLVEIPEAYDVCVVTADTDTMGVINIVGWEK